MLVDLMCTLYELQLVHAVNIVIAYVHVQFLPKATLLCVYSVESFTVLVTTIDAQWEGMGDVGSARYEPALLPPCPTIRVLSYSN